jgi:hypothetical protein
MFPVEYALTATGKKLSNIRKGTVTVAGGLQEPQTYKQAIVSGEAPLWAESMKAELAALRAQNVLQLVPIPKKVKLLNTRWVYKIKLDEHNKPVKYKSRLVVKGFMQQKGINYNETFAPVAKFKSIKMLLALAATHDLELHQIDFDTAFLNATLEEDVYISVPDGYDATDGVSTVGMCFKLKKALYGLKQAPQAWNSTVHEKLVALGYRNTTADPCVYFKYNKQCKWPIILCLYVDDAVVAFEKSLQSIWYRDKSAIASVYPIKDIGNVQWVLNMGVTRDRVAGTITLDQAAYIHKLLEEHNMLEVRSAVNPYTGAELTDAQELEKDVLLTPELHSKYRTIVGQVSYAANVTRVDVAWITNVLSRYVSCPRYRHLNAAKHLLRYLAGTATLGLLFKRNATGSATATPYTITAYSDADWAADKNDRRSTTGAVVLFNGNVISWMSKKQPTVALSSTESEYMAITKCAQEVAWYQTWVKEIFSTTVTALLFTDNKSAQHLCKNDGYHQRTKHIDIRHHWIRERVTAQQIAVDWVPTTEQLADILTKGLPTRLYVTLRDQLLVPVTQE